MLQVTGPNEVVILLGSTSSVGDARGMLSLCIPAAAIEAMEEKVAQGWQRTRRQPTADEAARLQANLGRVPLPVTALLETRSTARELLALQAGDVVALGHSAADAGGRARRRRAALHRPADDEANGDGVLIEQVSGS